jgi:hypothetical protein
MERAYRQGFADAQSETPPPKTAAGTNDAMLEWALIPPRPRTAFWSICLFALGRQADRPETGAHLARTITGRGTPGWRLVLPERPDFADKVIGERSVLPLIRLGLLEMAAGGAERLLLSARGEATWRKFLERGGHYPEDLTLI